MVDLSAYKNPPLMAIGDSLYQGVRSITIRKDMMALSTPRLVAEALGLADSFTYPDGERAILTDMERWLRMLTDGGLTAIGADYAANFSYWSSAPVSPSGCLAFDNVAIAAAQLQDLWQATPATAEAELAALLPNFTGNLLEDFEALSGDLATVVIRAFNTRFTLNPMADPDLASMSQFDWARERAPKRLLVNAGSNNGLYQMCFNADPNQRMFFGPDDSYIDEFAAQLESLPDAVEHIYVCNLALPRTVTNLMPIAPDEPWPKSDYIHEYVQPGPDAYFDLYENRFGFGYGRITGAEMKILDDDVDAANAKIRSKIRSLPKNRARVRFINTKRMMLNYDIKHLGEEAGRMVRVRNPLWYCGKIKLGTKMIDTSRGYRGGGMMSLDGMHPTTVGYGVMARQVVRAIEAKEGIDVAEIDNQHNFDRDTLLQDVPGLWTLAMWLYRNFRRSVEAPDQDRMKLLKICSRPQ